MITLECPDYGEIEIKSDLSMQACYNCIGPFVDHKDQFLKVLSDVSYLSINELEKLTDLDHDEIAKYYSNKLEVIDYYEEIKQSGKNPSVAFFESFKQSKTHKSLELSIKKIEQFTKPFLGLNQYTSITQSVFVNIQKSLSPFQIAMLQSKSRIDSYQNQYSSMLNALNKVAIPQKAWLNQNYGLLDSFKSIENRIQSSSLIFNQINLYNESIGKHFDMITKWKKNNLEYSNIFLNLNDSILQSKKIITYTNDYFSQYDIKLIKKQLQEISVSQSDEILETIEEYDEFSESEGITLQGETSELILTTNDLILDIREEFNEFKTSIKKFEPLFNRLNTLLNPPSILNVLKEFAHYISSEFFPMFWSKPGDVFNSNPESIAKGNLGIFLKGRFGDIAFVGTEIMRGDGFIDLFINFLGINYLLELKVVGASWPISWAESGINQLNNYMNTFNTENAYLIVFDGRKTKSGKQLQQYYDVSNGRIYVINIPIFHSK